MKQETTAFNYFFSPLKNFRGESPSFEEFCLLSKNLNKLLSSSFFADFLNHCLKESIEKNITFSRVNSMVFFNDDGFKLSVKQIQPYISNQDAGICSLTRHTAMIQLFLPNKPKEPLGYTRFLQPHSEKMNRNCLDPSLGIEFVGARTLDDTEPLLLDANKDIISWKAPLIHNQLYLCFEAPVLFDFYWEYRKANLKPARIFAENEDLARLENFILLCGEMGTSSNIEVLKKYLKHPSHFIRWASLQAISKLDNDIAIELIKTLTDDPHPHIQNAVQTAIEQGA